MSPSPSSPPPWRVAPTLAVLLAPLLGCSDSATGPGGDGSEALPEIPSSTTAWLARTVVPFEKAEPTGDFADLEPLREIVGDGRVVALGEATHGTREFFHMKDRILRFLIQEMGFDAFAIEATWPESNRVNDYVLTGKGDPDVLLSGLYFWTWNTEEVLQMIRWMREYNRTSLSPVQFFGFDLQFPGMAIHNVKSFVAQVDPEALPEVEAGLDCLERFANDPRGRFPSPEYRHQLREAYRDPCRRSLEEVHELLLDKQAHYEVVGSPEAFARALRSSRLTIQWEDMVSSRTPFARDVYMAENAMWLLDQLGPQGRIVLWAHNFHVSNVNGAMGQILRRVFGDDLVVFGFSFYRGSFNAVTLLGMGSYGQLTRHTVTRPARFSYSHYFGSAKVPRFFLDLRSVDYSRSETSWLAGPQLLKSIGAIYDPQAPEAFYHASRLPDEFDVMIYFHDTGASQLLPFSYPESF